MSKMTTLWRSMRHYGLAWTGARLLYELQARSGRQIAQFRQRPWDANELARWVSSGIPSDAAGYAAYWRQHRQPFFFGPSARPDYAHALRTILSADKLQTLVDEAQAIQQGCVRYFFSQSGQLGLPPQWHRNPFTGQHTSPTAHWSRIPMYSAATGDLKVIWEPGRFASAYTLARAFWASDDPTFAETFWQFVESWAQANPPNHGAHWRCGQETSLRLMAWCFALYAFADAPATTPERLALLVGMIAAQADRVAHGHVYARLQRNNHAISEGVGLWTVGLLFPELQHAQRWRAQGQAILVDEAAQQIADDGSYIQNSTNYHRLMLQDYLWALRLGDICGEPLPQQVQQRVRQAVAFLYQLQDGESGQVPWYGPNDGALIVPLNTCDYADFRPVLAAGHYLFARQRLYAPGPWEEDLLWLFGPEALTAPIVHQPRTSFAAPSGGYYVLRGERSFGLTRCTTYRYRPSQADMLHLDLWWRGCNIAGDPGTYSYYADPPWNNGLVGTAVHNTVTVDDQDQMTRGPRFLWFDWTQAETLAFKQSASGRLVYFQGQHTGYQRLSPAVVHHRGILRCADDVWVVVDDLLGNGSHPLALNWLLLSDAYDLDQASQRLNLSLACGQAALCWQSLGVADAQVSLVTGDQADAPRGWRSRYYGVREPALSFRLQGHGTLPCRFVSLFLLGDDASAVSLSPEHIVVQHRDERVLALTLAALDTNHHSLLQTARLNGHGQAEDVLE